MAKSASTFSALTNGFQFPNRFEIHLPVKYSLPFGGTIDLNNVVFGLCGGMCFTTLDYFYVGQALPAFQAVKDIDQKLFTYLCDRQLDSLKISVLLKVIEWMFLDEREVALRMSRVEIPKIHRMLDRNEPAVLALIRVQGLDDPMKNHQVLATGYDFNEATKDLALSLYDPNHPCEEPSIHLNLQKPSQGLGLSQSTGEALRGFFVIPYQVQPVTPAQKVMPLVAAPRAAPLMARARGESAFSLRWPVDSRRINQYFGENPDSYKAFGLPGHEGLDLFALSGANIYAAASGQVYQAGHPQNHPYGLHVRIRHEFNGQVYHTVYAHLSEVFVKSGQSVLVGERIGLADNTGNSFGSHLHLTLKIDGQQTPGYPAGIVDPLPYLQEKAPAPPEPLPAPSGLSVYTTGQVNLRSERNTDSNVLTLLPAGEELSVLGEANDVQGKIGVADQWLQVLTAGGEAGYVAAWLVQSSQQAFPPSEVVVYPLDTVNLRSGPGTAFERLAVMTANDALTVLGNGEIARSRIGKQGEWLQVLTGTGVRGYVAAWLVHRTGQPAQPTGFSVYPIDIVNIRARPEWDGNILTVVNPSDPLVVLGDQEGARAKIGVLDQWLNVQTPQQYIGYVAAWLVEASQPSASPAELESAELHVYPTGGVNLRAQPSVNSPRIGGANQGEALKVIEADLQAAREKVGKLEAWIYVEKQDGSRGWVAAWYLSLK